MLGMLCWQERGRVRLESMRMAGITVLCARVSRRALRPQRQLDRAARLLRRAGVSRVLPGREGVPRLRGLPVVEALPLYRALADRLVLAVLDRGGVVPERATVVLRGEYPDSDLAAAARALCPLVRQVVVDTDRGSEVLQRSLLRQFGAAVRTPHRGEPVLNVRFSGPPRGEPLILCRPAVLAGLRVDAPCVVLPETVERIGTLCALWQLGVLEKERFCVFATELENKFT